MVVDEWALFRKRVAFGVSGRVRHRVRWVEWVERAGDGLLGGKHGGRWALLSVGQGGSSMVGVGEKDGFWPVIAI